MSFGFSVGDFAGTLQLAWHLYRNCYQVARDAPQAFKSLKQELGNTHNSIKILQEEVANPKSILNSAGKDRVDMVNRVMGQVQETLDALEKHWKKYEKLGMVDRSRLKKFWDGIKWSTEASDLDLLRNKVSAQYFISYTVTTPGTAPPIRNTS